MKTKNLNHESSSWKEIERKFIIPKLPENIEQYEKKEITQWYLVIEEENNYEQRLRRSDGKEWVFYYMTEKRGEWILRDEDEVEISVEEFEKDWPMTKWKRLKKTRYIIPYNESNIELDVYREKLSGLLVAEVEFTSQSEAKNFIVPEFFWKEVTDDNAYKNQRLFSAKIHDILSRDNGILTLEWQHWVSALIGMIYDKLEIQSGNILVNVAWGSASWKTSAVASKLEVEFWEEALVLSADDYYMWATYMKEQADEWSHLNWDQPEAVNLSLLQKHIEELKQWNSIEKPNYSFKTGEVEWSLEVESKRIIIVEWLFVLRDELLQQTDIKAFVDIWTHGRIIRRMLRDVNRTGQKPDEIMKYFSEIVEPMNEKYINPTKQNADLIIVNDYNPYIESHRAWMNEKQIKLRWILDSNFLRELGAEKLSTTIQIDHYYSPQERNLADTWEALRIREEWNNATLTYKWPPIESQHRERAKLEFEIDTETRDAFLWIYWDLNKVIKKQRILYVLDWLIFSLDEVYEVKNGRNFKIWNFIELRLKDKNTADVNRVLKKLSLHKTEHIKESYFEM